MKYNYTKIGYLCYKINFKSAKFIYKHRWLYYLLSFTWGLPLTIIGLIVSLVLIISGHKPIKYHGTWYFEVGRFWGGLELGMTFIRDKESDSSLSEHEFGHTFQNCLMGPLTIFIEFIPSAIRYWVLEYKRHKGLPVPDYDAIWFESNASDIGKELIQKKKKKRD